MKTFGYFLASLCGGFLVLLSNWYLSADTTESTGAPQAVPVSLLNRAPGALPQPIDLVPAAERARPVVVHIRSNASYADQPRFNDPYQFFFGNTPGGNPFDYGPRPGSGSGIIYRSDGYIVTNNHVVDKARELLVTTFDNQEYSARVVGTYPESDIAVLKIDATNLPTLRHAQSDRARVGEWVLAVGNPFELTSTVTAGIISAKGRDIDIIGGRQPIESFLQTDAAVNPGNSGGALVSAAGELLGMNTAISTRTGSFEGYSFAIPIDVVATIADELIENGRFERAMLGIDAYDLDSEAATELGVDFSQGVVIDRILERGSAERSGLLPNDIIVRYRGQPIRSAPELQALVSRTKIGEQVTVVVVRNGQEVELPVVL